MPSLDLDSVVSLARADSALSVGTCLAKTKSQYMKLQRCSEGAYPLHVVFQNQNNILISTVTSVSTVISMHCS